MCGNAYILKWKPAHSIDIRVTFKDECWPNHPCHELGGSGWAVTVTRCHRSAARVHFTTARTRDGRTYEDVLVPLEQLHTAA